METPPQVSIVIPTYNRSRSLQRCLRSLNDQTYSSGFEVIVVDDGSSDDTAEIAHLTQREVNYTLHYLQQKNSGPATARNLGIKTSCGRYLVFLDDDHEVIGNWLQELCAWLPNLDVGVVNGKNDSVPDGSNLTARYVCFNDQRGEKQVEADKVRYLTSGNAAIRKETLESTRGFDETFEAVFKGVAPGGEDTELGLRIRNAGLSIVYQPTARTLHYREMTFRKLLKERLNFGRNRIRWFQAEGWELSTAKTVRNLLWTLLSTLRIPWHAASLQRAGYTPGESFAFATLDKICTMASLTGTLLGLGAGKR
ncbi:MAG: glycosyltransferase [bacterium]|nr:glycosyltransferase [bacterium]